VGAREGGGAQRLLRLIHRPPLGHAAGRQAAGVRSVCVCTCRVASRKWSVTRKIAWRAAVVDTPTWRNKLQHGERIHHAPRRQPAAAGLHDDGTCRDEQSWACCISCAGWLAAHLSTKAAWSGVEAQLVMR
jgi:hypothetical protein